VSSKAVERHEVIEYAAQRVRLNAKRCAEFFLPRGLLHGISMLKHEVIFA